MALPFVHLLGRPMWEHCDHDGTRIDGEPPGVRLAPMPEATMTGLFPPQVARQS